MATTKGKASGRQRRKARRSPSVRDLREEFRLSQPVFARLLGISTRTVASLDPKTLGTASLPRCVPQAERLLKGLAKMMRQEFVVTWLQEPLERLQGLKPIEVIERGEVDRIWAIIFRVGSGQPV